MAVTERLLPHGRICIGDPGSQRDQVANAGMSDWLLPSTEEKISVQKS